MSYRTQCLRDHLEGLLEGYAIVLAEGLEHAAPSVFDGPVVVITDRVAGGITLSLYGDDGDDLGTMAANLWRIADQASVDITREDDPMTSELYLSFTKMTPILDESDFHIGEALAFQPIEHSFSAAA